MKKVLILLLSLTFISCAGTRKPVGYEEKVSGGNPPIWTTVPADLDSREAKAFCGTSHNFSSDGEARDNALENARKQIVDAVGTYGKHVIDEVISSVGTAGSILDPGVVRDDATKLVSESLVKTRAREFHVEKWSRVTERGLEYYYKSYVLVLWNNADAQEAVKEALTKQAEKAKTETDKQNIDRALKMMEQLKSEDW
jgi:hypothetical protein